MFNIAQSYNFTTLAPSLLGGDYTNMKVTGIITYVEAVKRSDVTTKHITVKQLIPGLPATPNNLIFIVFTDASGNELVLAQDYIDPVTIVIVTTVNILVEVFDVASSMEPILRQRLKELGIINFKLSTV